MSLLTYIILAPFLGALIVALIPRDYRFVIRVVALASTLVSLVLAVKMFAQFDSATAQFGYKFVHQVPWVESLGISLAFATYWNATKDPLVTKLGWLSRAMQNRFYFDELYAALISVTHEALSKVADWFDRWVIAGLGVKGAHGSTEIFGRALRMVQTGNLQTYAFLFALGVALVLILVLK